MSSRTFSHKAIPNQPLRTLIRYNRPYARAYAIGAALAAVYALMALVIPAVVHGIVGQFEAGVMSGALLAAYVGGLVGASLVAGVGRYFQRTLMINASRSFEYDLRNDYFRHIQTLPRSFFNRTPTGDIMARATNDVNFVRELVGPGVMYSIDMLRVPLILGFMVYLSGRLTLISLVPLPMLSVVVYFLVRFINRQSKIVQEQFATVTERVQENLAGARVVKAYGIADTEVATFHRDSQKYMRDNLWLVAVSSFAWPLIGMLMGAALLLIIWQGGGMVIRGDLTLSGLTAFLVCLVMLAMPLAQFGWVLSLYQRGAVAMNRISDFMAVVPEIHDDEHTRPGAVVSQGAIVFDKVSFAYGDRPVLHAVSFTVPAGATVAIVGSTGSGKSTLVSLMAREFDPTEGAIYIDGFDLRRMPLHTLRAALGCVPQDTFIFSDSIRGNLAMARPGASEADIRHAAEIAQFDGDIAEMPEGFETLLGERGINLSGGQKQRLAIARAVLRDPKILLLDDAFSSVDTHTEERILQGLRGVMQRRTSVIISHRISTVQHADIIFVFDEGRIVEQGAHGELLALGGLYAAMHQRQLLEAALEDAQ